ncbi:hypothetical protein FPSE_10072 [Fusarium pseudograminearum CS3096]|uniref:Uncharacterized protein n=1 Tax=Fusarium pseudograminearum (strain CS3096) TaxID=1028729 RepID=K3UDY3_FUSPC|nr:hypothetical protein FPSE_10072 [Fusarium pseudograminearum CS3096]EKJ69756.1 hypothetical protein FPSE_10072 [Fusarium pseudograminearum CS3096]
MYSRSRLYIEVFVPLVLPWLFYFENRWFNFITQFVYMRRREQRRVALNNLVSQKKEQIWHAAISGGDGKIQKLIESVNFNQTRGIIAADVAGERYFDDIDHPVSGQSRMEAIADELANTSRFVPEQEEQNTIFDRSGTVSILWIAIERNHKDDVNYLLTNRNILLQTRHCSGQDTVLHKAVLRNDYGLTKSILETNSSISPSNCVNITNRLSETPLHNLVHNVRVRKWKKGSEELKEALRIFDLLFEHGASVNAVNQMLRTPLHMLLDSSPDVDINPLFERLLSAGAEVNSKDISGESPLHLACRQKYQKIIETLVKTGADMRSLDRNGKTPKSYYGDNDFWMRVEVISFVGMAKSRKPVKLPPSRKTSTRSRRAICDRSPVYCRFQQSRQAAGVIPRKSLHWIAEDSYISNVIYATNDENNVTFLDDCELQSTSWWDYVETCLVSLPDPPTGVTHEEIQAPQDKWRWVSLPANNMTWVKMMGINLSNSSGSTNSPQAGSMVSIVIPYLDIEVEENVPDQIEDVYFPFSGLDGAQVPQTLDQTFNSTKSLSGLRSKENQVIYRWSERQASRQRCRRVAEKGIYSLFQLLIFKLLLYQNWGQYQSREEFQQTREGRYSANPVFEQQGNSVPIDESGNETRMRSIQLEANSKWLMVRQLWLWKLNDGTILTTIPSRKGMCAADDLLETIRHSDLDEISTADDLMKHIVQQTVTFTERFKLAGLGEHILDIFESELAFEVDQEAVFFNNFTRKDWNSKYANKAINEAAGCTWRVKDIRGELRLINKVLTQQLDVLKEFAMIIAGMSPEEGKKQGDTLIRDSGLELLMERIKRMDEDAATTIEGLSNITQAMLAQASLKEAESARLMNFIILPFTVVTVIFTPLSFMTSLFAVNSDGFPHNDDGELRIPSDWLRDKMIIGEIGTLIPLLIIIVSISYLRTDRKRATKQ